MIELVLLVRAIVKAITVFIFWLIAFLLWPASTPAVGQTVHIPISVDYSFICANLIRVSYTQPGERAVPVDLHNGCTKMELWNPEVGPEQSLLKLTSRISLQAGLPISRACLPIAQWEGHSDVLRQIIFNEATSMVGLKPVGFQALGPILRRYLSPSLARSPADYLSFFGTSDALTALSRVTWWFLPQISRSGLVRLATLLGSTQTETALRYSLAAKSDLRSFFGLGQNMSEEGPAFKDLEIDLKEEVHHEAISSHMWYRLVAQASPASADEPAAEDLEQVTRWVMPGRDFGPYLDQVKTALKQASNDVGGSGVRDARYQALFDRLVLSTAWQESCWRQFTQKAGKVSPIISYNQSSVGLMQINMRVWCGIYRPESLLWNTPHNMRAGCEILALYLRRYALKDPASRTQDDATLARAAYAMYNGGPGQLREFLKRKKSNAFLKVDKLFWEKYAWAKAGQFEKLSACLGGK